MMQKYVLLSAILILISIGFCKAQSETNEAIAPPDWKSQVIYFLMVDRFNDGDSTNNAFGEEYDPTSNLHYNGGDLQGVIDQLAYIKNLGATTVWINPPVANQWWNPWTKSAGYHGYWAENFKEIDKHYGTIETYKQLANALHENDMYLIQDVVCNHTGDFFRHVNSIELIDTLEIVMPNDSTVLDSVKVEQLEGKAESEKQTEDQKEVEEAEEEVTKKEGGDKRKNDKKAKTNKIIEEVKEEMTKEEAADRGGDENKEKVEALEEVQIKIIKTKIDTSFFELNEGAKPDVRPSLYPFSLNDAYAAEDQKQAVYHFTPDLQDHKDKNQVLTHQLSGLDDLNTSNPLVRNALKDAYSFWINEVGVDGFRFDTPKHVEHDFWHDFIHSKDINHPGMQVFAESINRKNFFTFGETWFYSEPLEDKGEKEALSYLGTKEKPEMTSFLNFPLQHSINRVFAGGYDTFELIYRLKKMQDLYEHPELVLNFIDNHDMKRFYSQTTEKSFHQALVFLMTIPGIPVIYYGTEQNFTEPRQAMFAKGYGADGVDHFNPVMPTYKLLKKLIKIRKAHPAFYNGEFSIYQNKDYRNPHILAYGMDDGEEELLVLFNTSSTPVLLSHFPINAPEGTTFESLFSLSGKDKPVYVGEDGTISTLMRPFEAKILRKTPVLDRLSNKEKEQWYLDLEKIYDFDQEKGVLAARGTAGSKINSITIAVDGMLEQAASSFPDNDFKWDVNIPIGQLENGNHYLVGFQKRSDGRVFLSDIEPFKIDYPIIELGSQVDELDDDKGLEGAYNYPLEANFEGRADIKEVKVYGIGPQLQIHVKMKDSLSTAWNPPNGFDHVSFQIYIDLPDNPNDPNVAASSYNDEIFNGRWLDSGCDIMPLQNHTLPDGMKWDIATFVNGWNTTFYSCSLADENGLPHALDIVPKITTVPEENKVIINIPSKVLGMGKHFANTQIYLNTWDYDGIKEGLRTLDEKAGEYSFGGGKKDTPLIMDDIDIIRLK